jgi:hypothetical protein
MPTPDQIEALEQGDIDPFLGHFHISGHLGIGRFDQHNGACGGNRASAMSSINVFLRFWSGF